MAKSKLNRYLGDTHNYGRRVSEKDGWLQKHRSVFWESLFLGRNSIMKTVYKKNREFAVLKTDFFPQLKFRKISHHYFQVENANKKLFKKKQLSRSDEMDMCIISGQLVAIAHYFGITDLHYENLIAGKTTQKQLWFGPLDIEIVLEKMIFPFRTRLFPGWGRHALKTYGLLKLRRFLGRPIDQELLLLILVGYHLQLQVLYENQTELFSNVKKKLGQAKIPIRYLLRPTRDYLSKKLNTILNEEVLQLKRGDIPYFFRFHARPNRIYHYTSKSLNQFKPVVLSKAHSDALKRVPLLNLEKGWSKVQFKQAHDTGLILLFASLDQKRFKGTVAAFDFRLQISSKHFTLYQNNTKLLTGCRKIRGQFSSR